ncbi:MAG: hypothetical protein KBS98_01670 [Flavobacterium sp.]|nr:hypothetical protein [Candidatus Neoflavobacterium equi]
MRRIYSLFFLTALALFSCTDDEKIVQAERAKAIAINDSIVNVLEKNWNFTTVEATPQVKQNINSWNQWLTFKQELASKPSKNISSYRKKVDKLTQIAKELPGSAPGMFNKPQVIVRLRNLNADIQSLNSFISLPIIPTDKIIAFNKNISNDILSIQNQMDEIMRFNSIPKESGEAEMIRALDTLRHANFDYQKTIEAENKPE